MSGMPAKNNRLFSFILVICDFFVLLAAFSAAYILRVIYDPRPLLDQVYALDYFHAFLCITPFWILILACLGLYSPSVYSRRLLSWGKITLSCLIGTMAVISWSYVTDRPLVPARLVIVYALLGSIILIIIEREIARLVRYLAFRYGIGVSRVLIIGSTPITLDVIQHIGHSKTSGYQVVAVAASKQFSPDDPNIKHFSDFEEALKNIRRLRITTIIQTNLFEASSKNQAILYASQKYHLSYSFIPGEPEFYSGKNTVDAFLGYPMIAVSQTPLTGWSSILKRTFDLLAVVLTFPIWGLVFLVVAILQKLFNPGPVLFKQYRLGRHKKRFAVYKFRSMKQEFSGQDAITIFHNMNRHDLADEYSKNRKIKNDPRISRFGRVLRTTSLDELAQILNVLKGDMSLVGPRPILPDELDFYKTHSPLLLSVKPGITGLASVSGRSDLPFEKRVKLELLYAQNWTFWLDLKILLRTIRVVFQRNGAI